MCGDAAFFANLRRCAPSPVGGISNQNGLKATGVGTLLLRLAHGRIVKLNGALLVPGISTTLISSAQLYDLHGVTTTFAKHATLTRNGVPVAKGSRIGHGLYRLDGELVHPSPNTVGPAAGNEVCNACHIAHSSRLPFPHSTRSTSAPLELVHSDVLSVNVPSLSGLRYVVTFTDDFSRMLWVEPLARKSDVLSAFIRFKAAAENESGRRLRRFRSDNGGEFVSHAWNDYLHEHGIARETPPPYSPQSNGVAERVNRSIVEGVISLLNQAGAPKDLWAEALHAFVFVKNRSPHAALRGRVPLAAWRGRPVRVDMLRVWGCRAWHTVTNGRSKLDDKALPLIFVGYDGDTAAYRLFDPATRKVIRSRDARFLEHEFPMRETSSTTSAAPSQLITPVFDLVISPSAAIDDLRAPHTPVPPVAARAAPPAPARAHSEFLVQTPPPARPSFDRAAAPPPPTPDSPDPIDFLDDPFGATLAHVEAMLAGSADSLAAADDDFALPSSDPRNHREASRDADSDKWRSGEQDEFASLRDEYHV
ncbi:hypothetical protein JCM3770_000360, partial [Rhodotorula araucariae]